MPYSELARRYANAWDEYRGRVGPAFTFRDMKDRGEALRQIVDICDLDETRLLFKLPGVVAIGATLKMTDWRISGEPCLGVFVKRKLRLLPESHERVPERISGVLTDVVEVGQPRPAQSTSAKTIRPGASLSHHSAKLPGTLGCFVSRKNSAEPLMLSCNHVIANSNVCTRGDSILSPGTGDGGTDPKDCVGELDDFWPLVDESRGRNVIDAATAVPVDSVRVETAIPGIGVPQGTSAPEVGVWVRKYGKATRWTAGTITAFGAEVYPLDYDGIGVVGFVGSVILTKMSEGGDSGSLVLDSDNLAVGHLFADSEAATWCNDISNVLSILELDLLTL